MEDTPSNYNLANQRFDPNNISQNVVDAIDEEESQFDGDMGVMGTDGNFNSKRRAKKKKKGPKVYNDPSNKDLKMAKAYGG